MNIIIPKEQESYKNYIQRILESRDNTKDQDNYQEEHHILPKCMGGKDDKDNLIYLYGQEHYYAHKLLALENPNDQGLQCAWWNMCHCQGCTKERDYFVDENEYAEARSRFAEIMKIQNSGENAPNYGKVRSEEERKKQGETYKKHYIKENHPMYGKHHTEDSKAKMSKVGKGRKKSEEHKRKIGLAHAGKNYGRVRDQHGMAKKVQCIETGEIFGCLTDAGIWAGFSGSQPGNCIGLCAKGKHKTAGKHPITGVPLHWKFI